MINLLSVSPLLFLVYIVALLVAIAVHEFSHAFVADHLGDPTPRLQGRLNLNPFVHIDPLGLMFLFFFGFGWGKPVQFDPYNLKHPRTDAALISIAGPVSNLIIALILSIVLRLFLLFNQTNLFTISSFIITPLITLNVVLGVFNILPVSPLDGFKIVGGILPEEQSKEWYQLERFGLIFLLMLIFPLGKSSMLDIIIRPPVSFLIRLLLPGSILGGGII